jgi:cAMP-dependent protein kinase regulator
MSEATFANPFAKSGNSGGMQQLREDEELDTGASPMASGTASGGNFSPGKADSSSPFGSFNPGATSPSSAEFPNNYALGRRTSVSAESLNPTTSASDDWKVPHYKKGDEQLARLRKAVASNFLFAHLEEQQSSQVLGALQEKPIPAADIKVISQGDAGDYFYVVEKGNFDVYIHPSGSVQPGADGIGNKVASIGPGGSFGELALMYNAPRAATIVSTEKGSLLWALDRVTFRRILMDSAFQRRRMYESFLEEVPLLEALTTYERSKVADALETERFEEGATIINEGDIGEAFFLLESGEAVVKKKESGDKIVHRYKKGDYFGELALLDDKPRAASVIATSAVKVASLGKEGFQRLLGPVEERMRQNDPSKKQQQLRKESATGGHVTGKATEGVKGKEADVDPLQKGEEKKEAEAEKKAE